MIIDINKGSKGYGNYVTNRDENSYLILDGDLSTFETLAEYYRTIHNVEKPYYRVLLSFDEEHLDSTDITELYLEFKENFLSNYDPEEYQCFAVAHFDDEKPHVHMGIISQNLINHKELRLMRGNTDIKRIDSLAEVISYEHNLKSPKDSIPILKLTKEQKERNWKIKKGRNWYPCESDNIYDFIDSASKSCTNFNEFISILKNKYPSFKLEKFGDIHGQKILNIGDLRIKSFLFNEQWFEQNLELIREKPLTSIKTKIKRENYEFYKNDFENRNENHKTHLIERNIHEGLLEHKLKINQINIEDFDVDLSSLYELKNLEIISNENKNKLKQIIIETSKIVKTKDELEALLSVVGIKLVRTGTDIKKGGDYITVEKNNIKILIADKDLYYIANTTLNDILEGKREDKSLKHNNLRPQTFYEKLNVLLPTKHAEREIIKNLIINEVLKLNINNKDDFEYFLSTFDAKFIKTGIDVNKGSNITISFKDKNMVIFSDFLSSFYNIINGNKEEEKIKLKQEHNLLNNTIDSIFYNKTTSESLNEYYLNNISDINYSIESNDTTDMFFNRDENLDLRDRNRKNIIEDNNSLLLLKKSTDIELAAKEFIDKLVQKKWKNITVNGSEEFKNYVYNQILLNQDKLEPIINVYDRDRGFIVFEKGIMHTKETDRNNSNNKEKRIDPNEIVNKFKNLIDSLNTSISVKENKKILTSLLETVSNFNDQSILKNLLEVSSLDVKAQKKEGEISLTNIKDKTDTTNINNRKIYDFLNNNENNKSFDKTFEEIKKRALEIIYNKSFENSPILNYKIKIHSQTSKSKNIEYQTKNTIFIDSDEEITIYKCKNIEESVKDVLEVLKMKDLNQPINLLSSDEFKLLLIKEAKNQGIILKISEFDKKEKIIQKIH